jgi:adenine specific DNA methylase Mod
MAKIDITRTELVWPGKYDEDGNLVVPERVTLPFQVIERVNQTRATREERKEVLSGHMGTLFDFWQTNEQKQDRNSDGWKNKLIWGDNLYIMSSLLEHFAGKIDLVYIDPPFATGADFNFKTTLGVNEIVKEQSIIEEKAYRDTWGRGTESYLRMIFDRLLLIKDLISDKGCVMVHCDWRMTSLLRDILDEIFGSENFRNEIIWAYRSGGASKKGNLARKHDSIHLFSKSELFSLNTLMERQYLDKPFMTTNIDKEGRYFVDTLV